MDLTKWSSSYQKEANNTYFIYPSNEEDFKKAVFADNQNKGLVIRIFTNNNEFLLDRIVNSTQDSWSGNVTPQGFISTTSVDGEKIRHKYRNCKIYAVPKGYENVLPIINKTKFWLYKPGESASGWEEMYSGNLMGLGWKKLGDLKQYKDKYEIENMLKNTYPNDSNSRTNDKKALWDFVNTVKIGDRIIVAKGTKKIVGYGEVIGDYFFDDKKSDYFGYFRETKYTKRGEWSLQNKAPLKTLTDITDKSDFLKEVFELLENESLNENKRDTMNNKTKIPPLNQILYGPPGTGKTYSTIDKALEILRHYKVIDEIPESREDKRAIFDEYRANKQIEFVTFHQSFSYEEFVEGIKPNVENENERMTYEVKDGIFKDISEKALSNYQAYKDSLATPPQQQISTRELFQAFTQNLQEQLASAENGIDFNTPSLSTKMCISRIFYFKNEEVKSIAISIPNSNSNQFLKRDIVCVIMKNLKMVKFQVTKI